VVAEWLYPLGTVIPARSTSTETTHLYLAHDCTPGPAAADPGEVIETHWCAWPDLVGPDGAAGEPADAASLAAVLRADQLLHRIGGTVPTGGDLSAAAWAAWTAIQTRDPLANDRDRLLLVWLDAALGAYAEGAQIIDEIRLANRADGWDVAWARAGDQVHALA
jgi:hypothetical protein